MEVRLPSDKLQKCLSLIEEFLTKPKFTLKTLQSIIGTLNFACAVVLPGRAFLSRLIDMTIGMSKPHYFIRITREVREDMHMWAEFRANFNGRTIFMAEQWLSSTSLNLFTDASGTLGYGAVLGSSWVYGAWSPQWVSQNITLLELYPIVLAVQIWGNRLTNGRIIFHTDNQALVPIINKQPSPAPVAQWLARRTVGRKVWGSNPIRVMWDFSALAGSYPELGVLWAQWEGWNHTAELHPLNGCVFEGVALIT